jgi:transposase
LAGRIGKTKAIVATEHTILVAIWNMAQTGALYDDLGADYYNRLRPDKAKKRAIRQLESMGYAVTLDQAS